MKVYIVIDSCDPSDPVRLVTLDQGEAHTAAAEDTDFFCVVEREVGATPLPTSLQRYSLHVTTDCDEKTCVATGTLKPDEHGAVVKVEDLELLTTSIPRYSCCVGWRGAATVVLDRDGDLIKVEDLEHLAEPSPPESYTLPLQEWCAAFVAHEHTDPGCSLVTLVCKCGAVPKEEQPPQ